MLWNSFNLGHICIHRYYKVETSGKKRGKVHMARFPFKYSLSILGPFSCDGRIYATKPVFLCQQLYMSFVGVLVESDFVSFDLALIPLHMHTCVLPMPMFQFGCFNNQSYLIHELLLRFVFCLSFVVYK